MLTLAPEKGVDSLHAKGQCDIIRAVWIEVLAAQVFLVDDRGNECERRSFYDCSEGLHKFLAFGLVLQKGKGRFLLPNFMTVQDN